MDQVVLLLRVVVSLAVVVATMWALGRWARRGAAPGAGTLEVLQRTPVGRRSSVLLVRTPDGRGLLVGVTDSAVSLLAEVEIPSAPAVPQRREDVSALVHVASTQPEMPVLVAAAPGSALAGSLLSPSTWRAARDVLRDRTVRR